MAAMLESRLPGYQERVRRALEAVLPDTGTAPSTLHEAMRYATLAGGKRLRPLLVYAAGEALEAPAEALDAPAGAVELIHCYSLVHDDLPAMDDDDLRRGRPTCHRAYDEPTAILVGDALQALAFETLSRAASPEASRRVEMIRVLAAAAGPGGMVGGQAIDLDAVGRRDMGEADLEAMHSRKTGALIRASVRLGALCAPSPAHADLDRLDRYARCVGLAFQVQDDILDVTGDETVTGKAQGADARLNKPTYTSLMGVDAARGFAARLCDEALDCLRGLDERADCLRDVARYIVSRDR